MKTINKDYYFLLLIIHVLIGFVIFQFPFTAKIYSLLIIAIGLFHVFTTKDKNNEVLIICSYITGAEILLRMTEGSVFEFGKYSIILFSSIGILYHRVSNRSIVYIIYFFLLMPGVLLAYTNFAENTDARLAIAFNISGPICLAFASVYCIDMKISLERVFDVVRTVSYPIVSTVVYLYLYTPSIKNIVTSTGSNFEASGGFGPNQVSTILGLGIFTFFVLILFKSKNTLLLITNLLILVFIAFRGIITFSRGGIFTALVMILIMLVVIFNRVNKITRVKVVFLLLFGFIIGLGVWTYSSSQTNGLIEKRYSNQDARGRVKEDRLGGREVLFESEIDMFLQNPFLGVGVGRAKEVRLENIGIEASSHNELSRVPAEHGIVGIIILILLLVTPLIFYMNNKQNIFLLSFYLFWLLTINHAAMRLAAPAFIYALSLLKVTIADETKTPIHREQTL
jgi:hypothetical protein